MATNIVSLNKHFDKQRFQNSLKKNAKTLYDMNRNVRHTKYFLPTLTLVLVGQICFSQDTTSFKFQIDTTWNFPKISFSMSSISSGYSITHYPSKEDSIFCKKYSKLITAQPTKKNHSDYHSLACSLWQLDRLTEAENMFLKIMVSSEPYYVGTYYNSSDIPGDKTISTYGYGNYTSNYKNYACRYLSKIYIEKKKFDLALNYIKDADKKYIVEQNCGTGYMWYRGEIDGLYSLAYEGLGMYDSIINMFLPQYSNHSNGTLTRALKKVYSQTEINEYLKVAENSIICVVDTFQSSSFVIHNYREKDETTTEIKYTSGTATMTLFGRQVTLATPHLENGEKVSRELFVKEFKKSGFYTALTDNG